MALLLAGCQASAMDKMGRDVFNPACPASPIVWLTGVIVPGPDGSPALQADSGDLYPLIWGSQNNAVVEWGRRYKLGGTPFTGLGRWWVQCENEVIPL